MANHPVHRVTVRVDEADVLKRVQLFNTALFRVLSHSRLVEVPLADYEAGVFQVLVQSDGKTIPEIPEGEVHVRIEKLDRESPVLRRIA